MIGLPAKTQYGLLFLRTLAERREQGRQSVKRLSKELKIPYHFLGVIAQMLARRGLVASREGIGGGYFLERDPATITVGAVLRALDSQFVEARCTTHSLPTCQEPHQCGLCHLHDEFKETFREWAESVTVADLARRRLTNQQSTANNQQPMTKVSY